MREEGTSGAGMLIAFAAGAVLGAVAGLLLAPAAGAESRRRLAEVARKAAGAGQGVRPQFAEDEATAFTEPH